MNKACPVTFQLFTSARRLVSVVAGAIGLAVLPALAQSPSHPAPAALPKPAPVPLAHIKTAPPAGNTTAGTQALDLRMKFKPGDTSKYQMTMRANIVLPGQPAQAATRYDTDINMLVQQRVLKTNPDGSADVAISTLGGSGMTNGQYFKPATNANDRPAIITFDARNNIVTAKDLPQNANSMDITGRLFQSGALSTQGVYLPKQPVKIGDHWTQKAGIASLGNGGGTVQTTLVRLEPVGLFQTARLRSVMKVPFTIVDKTSKTTLTLQGLLSMVYDSNLALYEGKVVRSTGNGDITVSVNLPNAAPAPTGGGKRAAGGGAAKTSAPPTLTQKVTVKLQLGNNLITQ